MNLIQNDENLGSLEGMSLVVNRLRSDLSGSQEYRNRVATLIATAPVTPPTLVRNLWYTLRARRLAAFYTQMLQR